MNTLIQGWLLGIAYVAPIGMQNMFIINTALEKNRARALQVALIMICFDISLALAAFLGMGALLSKITFLKMIILGIGSIAVMIIGITLLRSKPAEKQEMDLDKPISKVILSCFIVTWLNPQALIDGTLLLAGFRATMTGIASSYFIIGVCIASAMWFLGISMLVSKFKKAFNPKIIQYINMVCGVVIFGFGLKLFIQFISEFVS